MFFRRFILSFHTYDMKLEHSYLAEKSEIYLELGVLQGSTLVLLISFLLWWPWVKNVTLIIAYLILLKMVIDILDISFT